MLILFPHPPGSGGPGSFQVRFENELKNRGWKIAYASGPRSTLPDLVFVVGGTRKIGWLATMKRRGVPIIYRLDGLLWLHRQAGFLFAPSSWLGSEVRNSMSRVIHNHIADTVVYQSDFVRKWWQREGCRAASSSFVVHNGVDLDEFSPTGLKYDERRTPNLICVEGHLDYSPYAIELLNFMGRGVQKVGSRLLVFGGFSNYDNRARLDPCVEYCGTISRAEVAHVYRDRIFLSLDINPACPNSVAEAMASGAPVIGFDTGSLKELVGDKSGCIVPFGCDPWKDSSPDLSSLLMAHRIVSSSFEQFSNHARLRAEELFDLREMVDKYLDIIDQTFLRCGR